MAKVLNQGKFPVLLYSKTGDSCQIPVGESKVQDKFCVNVPPTVKVLSLDTPVQVKLEVASKSRKKKGGLN